ncbi:hypothetical protein DFH07DRAFT_1061424 [Mycena maculata]|uniref:Uncharacterized protein n=1 Tax=Mycena maculata TaxID=230809 RepID=A0AAD7IZ51_9AGAR|nr:hypothetical protein DFH07DRAFT_1061424 [Mycena maculata]
MSSTRTTRAYARSPSRRRTPAPAPRRFPDEDTLASIPRSITAISGTPARGALDFEAFTGQLAIGTLPHLRALTWSLYPAGLTPLEELERTCARRGIDLRTPPGEVYDDNKVEIELWRKYIRDIRRAFTDGN